MKALLSFNLFQLRIPNNSAPHPPRTKDPGVVPSNGDGEVEAFYLMPMDEVMESLRLQLEEWKPNSALVAVDFLVRHGFVGPDDDPNYTDLVHLLRAAPPPRGI